MKVEKMKVVSQREVATNVFEIVIEGELAQSMKQPGQFVHIKVSDSIDPLLRRPISICNVDEKKSQFTMIYRKDGLGTSILADKAIGEYIDVLGPLGNGFPVEAINRGETALLVGGGVGVPPLYYLSQQLVQKGVKVVHVLGFATKDALFYEKEFATLGKTFIATVDGSYGTKGFVTDVIEEQKITFDTIYSCGPIPMLKALETNYGNKKGFISLEQRMGCGIGACFACVCPTSDETKGATYKKVCSDGPVFSFGEVVL